MAPTSSASGGPTSPTNTSTWTFTGTASDNVALGSITLWVRIPGAGGSSPFETLTASGPDATVTFGAYTATTDGIYEFYTVATDAAGNIEAPPATPDRTIVRDVTSPAATASSPAATNTSPVTVSVTYTDATSGVTTVELYARPQGAGGFSLVATQTFTASLTGTRTFSYTLAAGQGSYGFAAVAQDAAGNGGPAPTASQSTTTYDTSVPFAVSAVGPAGGTSAGSTVTVTVTFNEAIVCGGTTASCAAQWTYKPNNSAATATGSGIAIAADGFSATITFVNIPDSVHTVHDRIRYNQSADPAVRMKDSAGNALVSPVELSPSN